MRPDDPRPAWQSLDFGQLCGDTDVNSTELNPLSLIKPRRPIRGISAILLPFTETGDVDWPAFDAHLLRTAEAGLTPAVDMDTGFVHLLDGEVLEPVPDHAQGVVEEGGRGTKGFEVARPPQSLITLGTVSRNRDEIAAGRPDDVLV